jgi:hypothetical protein
MKRTASGIGIAAVFGLAVSLGAQTTSSTTQTKSSDEKEITVTGCLQRDSSGSGFVLANAMVDDGMKSSSSGATGTTGGTSTATSTTGSATGATSATPDSMNAYKLEGSSSDLEKHVGHKIQVTGRAPSMNSSTSSTTTTTGTTGSTTTGATTKETSKRLDVKSVKMISSSCS